LSTVALPSCSIQLRRTPRFDTDSCGSLLLGPAGDSTRLTSMLQFAGSVLPHETAAATHTRTVSRLKAENM
jgi:hypothetical protein